MKAQLALQHILIRREGLFLTKDLETTALGAIKGHHQQVQVYSQGIHHCDFELPGPDHLGQGWNKPLVVIPPGLVSIEMSFHGKFLPVLHDFVHKGLRPLRLQSERISGKIDHRLPAYPRKMECIPVSL